VSFVPKIIFLLCQINILIKHVNTKIYLDSYIYIGKFKSIFLKWRKYILHWYFGYRSGNLRTRKRGLFLSYIWYGHRDYSWYSWGDKNK
jgi:hypothetical protein